MKENPAWSSDCG